MLKLDEMTMADMAAIETIRRKNNCNRDEAIEMYSDFKEMADRLVADKDKNETEEDVAKKRMKLFQAIVG
jgi:hypothetical protein